MGFKQTVIDKMLSGELNGCVQLDETFDANSDEGISTAIFLDGVYQNKCIAASTKLGIVDRYKLKEDQSSIRADDCEIFEASNKPTIERAHGIVVILCCSPPILQFIKTLATKP